MSGPRLGRTPKNVSRDERKQAAADEAIRNRVEGKFGEAKRRNGLGRIMANSANTSAAQISLSFLVMNLEAAMRWLFFALVFWWRGFVTQFLMFSTDTNRQTAPVFRTIPIFSPRKLKKLRLAPSPY